MLSKPMPCLNAATGDLIGDGVIDATDLGILLGSWGAGQTCAADMNGDQNVDAMDLAMLLGNWS